MLERGRGTRRGRIRRRPALALAVLVALGVAAQASAKGTPGHAAYFDVRTSRGPGALASPARAEARARLSDSIGAHAVVDLDPVTGTPHNLMKLGGYLTEASPAAAPDVVMGYVRGHLADLGLAPADLGTFRLADDYADAYGVRHVTWRQEVRGIPVFDNFLRGNVTADGRLINIVGSPLSHVIVRSLTPKLSAEAALGTALRDAGGSALPLAVSSRGSDAAMTTRFVGGHKAQLALFGDVGGPRLAWVVQAKAGPADWYRDAIDANDGRLLRRANLVKFAGSVAAWEYHPGGGAAGARSLHTVPVTDATRLSGIASHVFTDLNDDDVVNAGEEVVASAAGPTWSYPFGPFSVGGSGTTCTSAAPCTWNRNVSASWQSNRKQNAAQVYYYLDYFHNWLARPQIGFTAAGHNFENADRVNANTDDGANTAIATNDDPGSGTGFPDFNHTDNASMLTLPDGSSPTMQMYLYAGGDLGPGTPSANAGDDASVVFHEYTHGLSSRLITDGSGFEKLDSVQAASMGEAWSDWYAMDNLVRRGLEPDSVATFGNVVFGRYLQGPNKVLRTEALDCRPGNSSGGCSGSPTAGAGGYTYGDLAKVIGTPEVHADGEIWGQTLWQLRDALVTAHGQALGSDIAEKDITGAMRLSPDEPSMLDERNALIAADYVYNSHADVGRVIGVTTARGMGYFASTTGSNDTRPVESFAAWPVGETQNASVHGTVRELTTNAVVPGAKVFLGGHTAVFDVHPTTTDASGNYTLTGLYPGHTYHVVASRSGYELGDSAIAVVAGSNLRNIGIRKNWAAGAAVSTNGVDYGNFDCGPDKAVDSSLDFGWSTNNDPGGYQIVVTLPQHVDLSATGGLQLAPGADCGDSAGSSLAHYRLYTSQNGTTWNLVSDATFTAGQSGTLQPINPPLAARSNVRYLKLVMLTPVGVLEPYIDMRELKAFGTPTP
jgi:hypothetical protein